MDEAIVDSVKLSSRYITSRQLPDKSVGLLDTACARVALSQSATPAAIEDTRRGITQCTTNIALLEREHATLGTNAERIDALKRKLADLNALLVTQEAQWQKEKDSVGKIHELHKRIEDDFHARALSAAERKKNGGGEPLSDAEKEKIKSSLQKLTGELAAIQGESPMIQVNVNSQAIAEVVANWTGIPVGKMLSDEIQSILNLKESLQQRVIGQAHALSAIAENVRTSRAGLTDPRKPIGVFLLVGPSGVGKTETALAVAEMLYGGEQNITTINMSEFKEEHKVSMLLGSPPGYVGFDQGGLLTEAIMRTPHAVLVLDEIEKAHPGSSVAVSTEYTANHLKLSEAHRAALSPLTSGEYSKPLIQASRGDNKPMARIFYLSQKKEFPAPAFEELAQKLKEGLMQKAVVSESDRYIAKLRKHYGYDAAHLQKSLPETLMPFSLAWITRRSRTPLPAKATR